MSSDGSGVLSISSISVESTISQMSNSTQTSYPSVETTISQMPSSTKTSDPRYIPNIYEIIGIGAGGAALLVTVMIFCMLVMLACLMLHVRYIIKKKQVYRIEKEGKTKNTCNIIVVFVYIIIYDIYDICLLCRQYRISTVNTF